VRRPCASPAGPTGGRPLLPADRDREPPHRVRQHGADGGGGYGGGAPRDEIVATTVGVPVKRLLILVTGTRYQNQLDEISYRIRALDPDLMSDERFDEQVRRLRAGRDRLKVLPGEPGRRDSLPAGDLYAGIHQALPWPSAARGWPRTGSWSTRRGNRSAWSRERCEGQLASGDRRLLGDEGPAFPGRGEHLPAGWAGLAAGLLARDPRALEPAVAAGAVQRGVQRDPHPGTVISPPGRPGADVAAAAVTGWLIIQFPVSAAVLILWRA
jgi:hypothetical protein